MRRIGFVMIASVALLASCSAPPVVRPLGAPAPTASVEAPTPSATTPSATPTATPAEPRVGADAAREAAERAFAALRPAIEPSARLEAEAAPACTGDLCVWKRRVLVEADTEIGTIEVDAASGAVTYAPNDGRDEHLGVDAFLARDQQRTKALAAVTKLPIVKAYCKKVEAQHLRCLMWFGEEPTQADCGASPPLESSCWMTVEVAEIHPTHTTRFATFLVDPKTWRVVGALGYCATVPIARFTGSGSGCDK